jgi:copper chaperone CopZ
MKTVTLDLPTMFGDHHVVEVRRLLFELKGVEEVNASSAFRVIEVSFKEDQIAADQIKAKLDDAGYLGEIPIPVESSVAVNQRPEGEKSFFRHTAAFEQVKNVGFGQQMPISGRPLWPCPGMGPVKKMDEQ